MGEWGKLLDRFSHSREAKNAGWIIVGKILHMALSFVVSIFAARYLGPSNFGTINYAAAYIAFFTSLCNLGINSVIIKDFINNPSEQGISLGTTLVLRAISSVLSSFAIVGIVCIVDSGDATAIIVVALSCIAVVFQVFDSINYWFQARYESKVTSLATLVSFCLTSIYKIYLLVTGKSVYWFAFATSVDYICLAILLFGVYKKVGGPKLGFSFTKGKYLLASSYHYILSGMMVAIYGHTDRLMLKQMLDESSVGYYSLAASISGMWVFFLKAVIDSAYPTIVSLYANDRIQFEKKNRQLYALIIYTSLFMALMFTFFGKLAIILIYGSEYVPAFAPLKVITWYTMFSYLGVARNAWIVCENKQKYLKYMYLSAAVVNVFLNLVFIPFMGTTGAALASLITQVSTCIALPAMISDMRPNVKLMLDAFLMRGLK